MWACVCVCACMCGVNLCVYGVCLSAFVCKCMRVFLFTFGYFCMYMSNNLLHTFIDI